MKSRRSKSHPSHREGVVRGPREARRGLDPAFTALAAGDENRLSRPRPRPRLRDPRPIALVPGVKNSEARAVFEQRHDRLQAALAAWREDPSATEPLARALAETLQLRLWRARSLTSFEALTEQLLGMDAGTARALVADAGLSTTPARDETVACWLRAEAALLAADAVGRVMVVGDGDAEVLRLELPAGGAPRALRAIGRALAPLADDVSDRPAPRRPPRRDER